MITVLFVAAQFTPAVPYDTRMDRFMSFSFFIVGALLVVQCITYGTHPRPQSKQQQKQQLHSRAPRQPNSKHTAHLTPTLFSSSSTLSRFIRACESMRRSRTWDMISLPTFFIIYTVGVLAIFNA